MSVISNSFTRVRFSEASGQGNDAKALNSQQTAQRRDEWVTELSKRPLDEIAQYLANLTGKTVVLTGDISPEEIGLTLKTLLKPEQRHYMRALNVKGLAIGHGDGVGNLWRYGDHPKYNLYKLLEKLFQSGDQVLVNHCDVVVPGICQEPVLCAKKVTVGKDGWEMPTYVWSDEANSYIPGQHVLEQDTFMKRQLEQGEDGLIRASRLAEKTFQHKDTAKRWAAGLPPVPEPRVIVKTPANSTAKAPSKK
jgi:hypothetical protein